MPKNWKEAIYLKTHDTRLLTCLKRFKWLSGPWREKETKMKKQRISLDTAKREYKEKMRTIMPDQFLQKESKEKTSTDRDWETI